jgi:CheY-specific phosphatase CheX
MSSMFFGQFLLSRGAISREALIEAIERQRRTNLSLVEVAVRQGDLEARRAETILARYRTGDDSLDELCLEHGHIDRDRLEELKRIRRSDWVRFGAALIAGGHLSPNELEHHLAEFHAAQSEAGEKLEADFQACPAPETVRTVVELAVIHLKRCTDIPVKLRDLSVDGGELADGRRRYAQKLVGDRELHLALDMPSPVASVVARGLIGVPVEDDSDVAIDAVCEFVNIIGGNACTSLAASGHRLRPEPPFATDSHQPSDEAGPVVRARVLAGESEIDVRLFL